MLLMTHKQFILKSWNM